MQSIVCSDAWATPFEVYLAANKFNCIIHLFHSEDEHYCFQPDDKGFKKELPTIFLKSECRSDGQFFFQWYRVEPKTCRTKSLYSALRNWLGREEVRPISAHLLGVDEGDFVSKCSKILKRAHDQQHELLKTMPLVGTFSLVFNRL